MSAVTKQELYNFIDNLDKKHYEELKSILVEMKARDDKTEKVEHAG